MGGGKPVSKNCEPENEIEFPTAPVASSSVVSPQWIDFPGDVTANILQRLGAVDILESAQNVCTTWWRVCQDPAMWRVIHITKDMRRHAVDLSQGLSLNDYRRVNHYTEDMYRRAVDLSQGQLVDLSIDNFGDRVLLNYIVDRSSHLKRLALQNCFDIRPEVLVEAVKKLAHLEELHLIIMPLFQAEDILNIVNSCPMLKSFSYGSRQRNLKYFSAEFSNEFAQAVTKSMPNLRHLCLVAIGIENEGLEAILDGCPYLESLDLRRCFRLDLQQGALLRRCSEQIKHVKYPFDSISDIKWDVGRVDDDYYDSNDSDDDYEEDHYYDSNDSDDDYEEADFDDVDCGSWISL